LGEAQATMCPAHDSEAAAVTQERLARAAESNADGWAAVVQACPAIDRPAPTWDLRRRLRATLDRVDPGWPTPGGPAYAAFVEEVGADADLVVALAADHAGDNGGLDDWLSGDWDRDRQLRDWLADLLPRLAHAGLTELLHDQPGRVSDARAARAELAEWSRRHGWISATPTPAATATDTELAPQVPEPGATPPHVRRVKVGRNDPCPCGSGRKHKRCCGDRA
ncbi:MAG: SEC-C metal-binding domain-containing protein, partial [Egibacteraceae bacterium]